MPTNSPPNRDPSEAPSFEVLGNISRKLDQALAELEELRRRPEDPARHQGVIRGIRECVAIAEAVCVLGDGADRDGDDQRRGIFQEVIDALREKLVRAEVPDGARSDPEYRRATEGEALSPLQSAIHGELDTLFPADPAQVPAFERVRDTILELAKKETREASEALRTAVLSIAAALEADTNAGRIWSTVTLGYVAQLRAAAGGGVTAVEPVPQMTLPAQMTELRAVLVAMEDEIDEMNDGIGTESHADAGRAIAARGRLRALRERALHLCPIQFDDNHAGSRPVAAEPYCRREGCGQPRIAHHPNGIACPQFLGSPEERMAEALQGGVLPNVVLAGDANDQPELVLPLPPRPDPICQREGCGKPRSKHGIGSTCGSGSLGLQFIPPEGA